MAERQWTKQQQAAIEARGGTLLVSAAAGSGKTAVLVERALRLVTRGDNPVPADRLLILTFTNAAAEELRSRIAAGLEEKMRGGAGPELKKQAMLLRRAFIGTLDAYCQRLVSDHFSRLALPADIALGERAALKALEDAAIAEVMEEMYADEDFVRFSALYGKARSDEQAQQAVLELYAFTRTLPFPEQVLQRFAQMYAAPAPLKESLWGRRLLAYARRGLLAAEDLLAQAMAALAEDEALLPYAGSLLQDTAAVQGLLTMLDEESWDACVRHAVGYTFPPLSPIRGYEGQGKAQVGELRKAVKAIFDDLKKYCFACTRQEYEADMEQAGPLVQSLCRAAQSYGRQLYAAKLEAGMLDFDDYEHLALGLLQRQDGGRTPFADEISAGYAAVMVDEYQDTNALQDALYSCLAAPGADNLFYVGDVKQSIYRFRKAEPWIFIQKKAAWPEYGRGEWPAVIRLGHNFRSGAGVIGGVNDLFNELMSPGLGEIDYNEEERLLQGSPGGDEKGLELCVLETAEGKAEAAWVARRIRRMVEQGYPVRQGEGTRPCGYGDFCVLLRARGRMQEFAAALEAEGIPLVADTAEGALASPEVLPMLSVLAALDSPGDDVALAAALMGPFFAFTPDEMLELRDGRREGSLWGALLQAAQARPRGRAAAALEKLRGYRAYGAAASVGDLCRHIAETSGYLAAVAAMEGGVARRENLRRFLEWAQAVSAGGRGGIGAFLRLAQGGGPQAPGMKSLAGHVSLMTIHRSKGLEFPVCILADMAHRFNTQDLVKRVQMDPELGIGLQLSGGAGLYASLPLLAVRAKLQSQSASEEMRVLYVALTRAKDKAVMCFAVKDAEKALTRQAMLACGGLGGEYLLSRAPSASQWVLAAALRHPQSGPLLKYTGGFIPRQSGAAGNFELSVEHLAPEEEKEEAAGRHLGPARQEEVSALLAAFARPTPRRGLQAVPLKLSVSALVKQEGAFIPKRPSFMYGQGLTAAEKGSAQHAFMQYANFAAAQHDAAAEAARLAAAGHLSPQQAAALDMEGIKAFLHSGLYARALSADRLLREYDFITAIPAKVLNPALGGDEAAEPVMLQGIADLVLVKAGQIEIADYKTDRQVSAGQLAARYAGQLQTYATAISRRLEMPVTRLTIWSFSLNREVDVPLGHPAG